MSARIAAIRRLVNLGKGKNKKVELSLLVHPQWLAGSPKQDANDQPYGGSAQDDVAATTRVGQERASKIRLLEVRGALPEEVTCPETNVTFKTNESQGSVPKQGHFTCASCGTVKDQLSSFKQRGKPGHQLDMQFRGSRRKVVRKVMPTMAASSHHSTRKLHVNMMRH